MEFQIFLAYPPDRESKEAQLCVPGEGVVSIPASVYQEDGRLLVEIFSKRGGEPEWVYPVADFIEALQRAAAAFGGGQ